MQALGQLLMLDYLYLVSVAQHNPALKALVPASVRIQRQKEVVPPSKRPRLLNTAQTKQTAPEEKTGKAAEDDQYLGFLDSVSGLGAFDQ